MPSLSLALPRFMHSLFVTRGSTTGRWGGIARWGIALSASISCIASSHAIAQQSIATATRPVAIRTTLDNQLVEWAWTKQEIQQAGQGLWPQYRGPHGDGVAAPDADPPVRWSESENVRWRLNIPGKAWSSPIVWGSKIWITNATNDGLAMSILAIDRETGKILIDRPLFTNEKTQKDYHEFNSYGSPTPICDSQHVYVTFGAYGTAALNPIDGSMVWQRRDLPCNHYRGAGSSPILFNDLLIFSMDGFDYQYIVALNKHTGETVWKTDRAIEYGTDDGDWKKAYSTPHVIQVGDQLQLISPAAKAVIAYEPSTGKELWRVRYEEHSSASAMNPETGELVWQKRLGGDFSSSPIVAGGRIYCFDEQGKSHVVDREGNVLSENVLDAGCLASPVAIGKDLIVRTRTSLYCLRATSN
jgi:outer membrane protein assembly factor BamB